MAKIDMSDLDVSNPDPSVLNPSEDDTTNLNPSKPDLFKPDPPDPVLLNPTACLREKDPVFSRDERCGFKFDTVALARGGNLHSVQNRIADIEAFARDLRKN